MVLSDTDKKIIIEKYNIQQLSMRKIAQEMNVNLNTVKLWINRFNENKSLNRKRSSRYCVIRKNNQYDLD